MKERPFKKSKPKLKGLHKNVAYETSRDFRHSADKPITHANIAAILKENPAISTTLGVVQELVSLPTPRHIKRAEYLMSGKKKAAS